MNGILQLKDIEKSYGKLKVLDSVTFGVPEREIVCLLGPSGSGKTTLFRIAAGLTEPDKGRIIREREPLTGYVFQEPRLLPWKTVEENLKLVQENFLEPEPARKLRRNLLRLTGLDKFSDSYPAELSGGMKQRIGIIRALAIRPELLLLDEPFKSVDTRTRVNFHQLLLRLYKRWRASIFMITHDPEEAVLLADRIYVLSGKPATIVREFVIDYPRTERVLKNEKIYGIMEEIKEIFLGLVDEFDWEEIEELNK